MKANSGRIASKCMLLIAMLLAGKVVGQDGRVADSVSAGSAAMNVNERDTWYSAPWVWIVGSGIFALLIIAIVKRKGRRLE